VLQLVGGHPGQLWQERKIKPQKSLVVEGSQEEQEWNLLPTWVLQQQEFCLLFRMPEVLIVLKPVPEDKVVVRGCLQP